MSRDEAWVRRRAAAIALSSPKMGRPSARDPFRQGWSSRKPTGVMLAPGVRSRRARDDHAGPAGPIEQRAMAITLGRSTIAELERMADRGARRRRHSHQPPEDIREDRQVAIPPRARPSTDRENPMEPPRGRRVTPRQPEQHRAMTARTIMCCRPQRHSSASGLAGPCWPAVGVARVHRAPWPSGLDRSTRSDHVR